MLHYDGNWQIGILHNGNRFDVLKLMIRIESEIQQSSRRIPGNTRRRAVTPVSGYGKDGAIIEIITRRPARSSQT
jgi:hypothetical protein